MTCFVATHFGRLQIIDAFALMRNKRNADAADLENKCFVSSIERFVFNSVAPQPATSPSLRAQKVNYLHPGEREESTCRIDENGSDVANRPREQCILGSGRSARLGDTRGNTSFSSSTCSTRILKSTMGSRIMSLLRSARTTSGAAARCLCLACGRVGIICPCALSRPQS